MRYTFGTNDIAAQRLEKIGEIFNPHSSRFIRKYASKPVVSALDLGCGPGFTTHMLFMTLNSREVYGLDRSEEFLERAAERFGHSVFIKHDLAGTSLPLKAEVMYSRFILAHLSDPVATVNRWSEDLCENGLLFLEEVEDIKTDNAVFKRYLEINRGLVASQGANLYAGELLSKGKYSRETVANESFELPITNSQAAALFYPNAVNVWEKENYVLNTVSPEERRAIAGALSKILSARDNNSGISWKLRRIVLKNSKEDPYFGMFI
ncbi:MAG TPA: hypothetical protein DEE98_00250 [Elusimicrobia bacterium]|nr:MAG: hypothetical protein A2278_08675 [Elusimicrobia bacterium RIFOXYA12_FULL_49_49]OGS09643.1 MAG: hypothetical protein A2204_04100 [Elusimicrobia bacterium RIFOXYA1_FULL_47_7]OGS10741.1 MAG: hypothetical protein A2386_01730 [Elusimicrobia bacterium RIFOXYB1_FULL_48_9]OGS14798.1 MAG: hypothetical protein A2251_09920 [Elusimicrobia bacterium RIFOXYA2_FULL_47_53]OGS25552.1 MAG: hypothetical protein A2339_05675 [Elusimicrobia bacterium RIFOXYB12_FULL_50_12]OGS28918.1 MAG: hypothetical protein